MPSEVVMGNTRLTQYAYSNDTLVVNNVFNDEYNNAVVKGENYKDWRERIAEMRDATTTLDGSLSKSKNRPGTVSTRYKTASYKAWTTQTIDSYLHAAYFKYPTAPTADIEPLLDRALTRWYQKATAAQRKFGTMTFLGEFAEAVRMFKQPLSGLRRGIDDYRDAVKKQRSRNMSWSSFRRMASETWLEYSFGWTPFVMDLNDWSEAANTMYNKARLGHEYIYARDTEEFSRSTVQQSFGYGYSAATWKEETLSEAVAVYRGVVGLDSEAWPEFLQVYGLSTRDFIDAAWELTPWSFLIDYFVDIQGILNAWSFPKATIKWSNHTTIRKARMRWYDFERVEPTYPPKYYEVLISDLSNSGGESQHRLVNRYKHDSPPLPGLVFDLPGFRQSLNISALMGAGSLRNIYRIRGQ